MSITLTRYPKALKQLVDRYYIKRHGRVCSVKYANNLLGEPLFREVTFRDGAVCSFSEGFNQHWFRNERHARLNAFRRG